MCGFLPTQPTEVLTSRFPAFNLSFTLTLKTDFSDTELLLLRLPRQKEASTCAHVEALGGLSAVLPRTETERGDFEIEGAAAA